MSTPKPLEELKPDAKLEKALSRALNCHHVSQRFDPLVACRACVDAALREAVEAAVAQEREKDLGTLHDEAVQMGFDAGVAQERAVLAHIPCERCSDTREL